MDQWPRIRRLANGAIDYDFYRGRVRTLRTQAISDALESLIALFFRIETPRSLRDEGG